MRYHVIGLVAVLAVGGLLSAQQGGTPPPGDADSALEKKIKDLRDQIEELRKKQDALEQVQKILLDKKSEKERQAQAEAQRKEQGRKAKEEADRQAKEAAEKKKHYAKVEIRGKLVTKLNNHNSPITWHVVINEMTWNLDFGKNKELQGSAEKLVGEGVLITGVVVNKRVITSNTYPIYPNPIPNPGWPNPMPNGPSPHAIWPNPYPGWPNLPEAAPTITVESLVVAKD
jgi:hypothetical protein